MEFVRWFEELDKNDLPLAGGKGASLAEMVRAGLQVPPGFVLTTGAYRMFVETYGFEAEIERLVDQVRPEESTAVEEISIGIRALFEGKAIPEQMRQEIVEAYEHLGGGAVAVRSSATAEDLPSASFAGQQESFLNVEGVESLLETIPRCWSSLWTARSIVYRARQGMSHAEVSLAVVIQQLVTSEVSGILFTANPVNGRRDQVVVDAAWGLGEAIVSGQVTPDQWVLDRTSGAIVETHPGHKTVMTVRTAVGTALLPVEPDLQDEPVLDTAGLSALADLGRRVTDHFGLQQDIEWAIASGRLYLLQSRPITSLFPIPEPAPPVEAGLRVFACVNYLQGFPEPFTPLGIEAFRGFARGGSALFGTKLPPGIAPGFFKVATGRIYFDITSALQNHRSRVALLNVPRLIDRPMGEIFRLLLAREPSLTLTATRFPFRPSPWLMVRVIGRALVTVLSPKTGRRMAVSSTEQFVQSVAERAGRLEGVEARLAFFQNVGEQMLPTVLKYLIPLIVPAMAIRFFTEAKLKDWLGDASGLQPILRSLPYNPTTEMDLALWRLSRELRAEGSEPSATEPAVGRFLAVYGHRGVREIDIGMPRWRDDATPILEILQNYLSHGEQSDPEAQFRRGAEEAERAADELVTQVRRKKGRLKAEFMRFLIGRIRALMGTREIPKFTVVKLFAVFRQVALGAGAELVAAGRLVHKEDIAFLDLKDWASNKDLCALAEGNRARYEQEIRRRNVPRVVTSTGEVFYGVGEVREGSLVGTPASVGVYEGRVRVIFDPRGAQLEQGEVLVAPGTDPAWTPLFLTAGALVMEIGGIMSHGSVVAREYGIPAVVGVAGATEQLKTGQRVRVDGESGLVTPLD